MGRPRDASKHRAILDAARAIIEESGFEELSMEGVARRAGVGKPTVYRRWQSPAELAFAATVDRSLPPDLPDTGSFAGDVAILLRALVESNKDIDRALVGAVLGRMVADAEFAETVIATSTGAALERVRTIWDRAVERGELRDGLDGARALQDLSSEVQMAMLVYHRDIDEAGIEEMADRFLHGVLPAAGETRGGPGA